MWFLRYQIADAIHKMHAWRYPEIGADIALHDGPNAARVHASCYLQIFTECLQTMAAPNIEMRRWMPERPEICIENVFMENGLFKHLQVPMG
jgi:hypothetical protein